MIELPLVADTGFTFAYTFPIGLLFVGIAVFAAVGAMSHEHERANRKRATVIERAKSLQENEPFPGYDDLTARDVAQRVRDADEATAQRVRAYESSHQRRVEVLETASHQLSGSSS